MQVLIETPGADTLYATLTKLEPAAQLGGPITNYKVRLNHAGHAPDGRTLIPVGVALET
jgi:hypothetical protein